MNPFSRFLSQKIQGEKFLRFVQMWDLIERIVIDTFREQGDLAKDTRIWRKIRVDAQKEYMQWQAKLSPFWRNSFVGGAPPVEDPFLWLLSIEEASELEKNWRAMQTLPVAREAINRMLLELKID